MLRINRKSGFTLIELLVVISIIGLLASIVLVSLNAARLKARDSQRLSAMVQMRTALELYYAANGRYPISNISCGGAWGIVSFDSNTYSAKLLCKSDGVTSDGNTLTIEMDPYIPRLVDPSGSTNDAGYLYSGNGSSYCFFDYLEPENMNNFPASFLNMSYCTSINSSGKCSSGNSSIYIGGAC